MLIHLTHDIRYLIKLSFNTLKSTMGLDALSLMKKVGRDERTEFTNSNLPSCVKKLEVETNLLPISALEIAYHRLLLHLHLHLHLHGFEPEEGNQIEEGEMRMPRPCHYSQSRSC
jgi:hypothetical protein